MQVLERLIDVLGRTCAGLPDKRVGDNAWYSMRDIALAGFSVFFMQSPSFLAHQRQLAEGSSRSNCATLFGVNGIPTDNHVRAMLDPVSPDAFHPVFETVLAEIDQADRLAPFRRLGGHALIALDGTEYFTSSKIHCANCSQRRRSNGQMEYFHQMLSATLVAPGHRDVVPLAPEFIAPQDGADKQDCEQQAVHRWLARHGETYSRLAPIYLGDDLFAHQPTCEAVQAAGGHFLFVCKPGSHKLIAEYVGGAALHAHEVTERRGGKKRVYRYTWLPDVPLRDSRDAMTVNWLQVEIRDGRGKVTYRNAFVTDLPVDRDNVAELAACGRARWKIENESFNVLKQGGYNLEHNFGHGQQNLDAVLVVLNLLAFAFHTVCDLAERAWQRARQKVSSRRQFFDRMEALTSYLIFPSWQHLVETLAFERSPPRPP